MKVAGGNCFVYSSSDRAERCQLGQINAGRSNDLREADERELGNPGQRQLPSMAVDDRPLLSLPPSL